MQAKEIASPGSTQEQRKQPEDPDSEKVPSRLQVEQPSARPEGLSSTPSTSESSARPRGLAGNHAAASGNAAASGSVGPGRGRRASRMRSALALLTVRVDYNTLVRHAVRFVTAHRGAWSCGVASHTPEQCTSA